MREITTFKQANQALAEFISEPGGPRRYTLDRMHALMRHLGSPQDKLKIIHIAGTSGKTSTAYFVASILASAGFSTGLTVSPHVDEVNERAQINLKPLEESVFCRELGLFLGQVDASGLHPTYFEVLVAFSFWLFEKQKVDYAIVEVGIGGLLDCTNVIYRPDKICVITDIGLDHTAILGNTTAQIAAQKAGIIHPSNTVFMNRQDKAIMNVFEERCQAAKAQLHVVSGPSEAPNLPLFQQRNFGLALRAAEFALKRDTGRGLNEAIIKKAANVYVPARMELVDYGGKTLILDGSHNEQKISALTEAVIDKFPDQDITLLVCFGRNKQSSVEKSMRKLRQISSKIILTSFGEGGVGFGPSMDASEMATLAKKAGFSTITIETKPAAALELLMKDAAPVGLITGSFYSLNNFRPTVSKK